MRRFLRAAAAIGWFGAMAGVANAQDIGEVGAWYGMMFTPFGALPPVVTPAMANVAPVAGRSPMSFDARYGHWDFGGGEEPVNAFGLAGRARNVGLTAGYMKCDGCDGGLMMLGVDFESVLTRMPLGGPESASTLVVGVRPGLGYSMGTGDFDETKAFSATVDLPVSLSVSLGTSARIVPFVAPGLGFGRFEDSDPSFTEGESGVRGSIGAGIGLLMTNGLGVHFGWRQVILEDAPSILGLGVSISR